MKNKKWLIGLAAVAMLASCTNGGQGNSGLFDNLADAVTGTVTLTYDADYEVTVNPLEGMEDREHKVSDKTVAELDLTEGNLYAHVVRNGTDLCHPKGAPEKVTIKTKKEALVYKKDGNYYYLTSQMGEAVKLADETAALAKINEVLDATSKNYAGSVNLGTLLYETGKVYEWKNIALSAAGLNEDPEDPSYVYEYKSTDTKTEEGFSIVGSSKYVGYITDSGAASEFNGDPAVTYTINAKENGYVTKLDETINSSLVFHLGPNTNPTTNYVGTRKLAATYGAKVEKLETIEHEQAYGKLDVTNTPFGTTEIHALAKKGDAITAENLIVADKQGNYPQQPVGYVLAIKVDTPNTINSVNNNGASVQQPENGYYYLDVVEGKNAISVAYHGTAFHSSVKFATLDITLGEGVEYEEGKKPAWYNYKNPTKFYPLEAGNKAPVVPQLFVLFPFKEAPKGQEYKITTDPQAGMMNIGGISLEFKAEGTYKINVELVEAKVNLVFPYAVAGAEVTYAASGEDQKIHPIEVNADNTRALKPGSALVINAVAKEGNKVESITINGQPCKFSTPVGQVFFLVAGENKIEIKVTGTNVATEAKIAFTQVEGGPGLAMMYVDPKAGPTGPAKVGEALEAGKMLMFSPTGIEKTAKTIIRVNGMPADFIAQFNAWYIIVGGPGTYNVTIEVLTAK